MEEAWQEVPRGFTQSESCTSRTLQVCLQFNLYLSGIFLVMEFVVVLHKLRTYEMDVFGQVLTPLTFGVWACSETFRLWFGFTGNLQEKLPQLSVFFLLSFFPQLPCLLYLMQLQDLQLPFETALAACVLALTCVELFVGYRAAKKLVRKQTISYVRLAESDEYEDAPKPSSW